jgi:glycosyltransferase involved in cell wall biosynthesis
MNITSAPLASNDVHVTVAICTWNRASLLNRTLESFRQLDIPQHIRWEVIVVDNRCTDSTPDVIQGHADHLPIRRVYEQQQGHSASRNAAVRAARGELLLWTDDDVQVEPQWVRAYWDASLQRSDVAFWGGVIQPDFEVPCPAWVAENWTICSKIFAIRDVSAMREAMSPTHLPFGANFAIRTKVQQEFPFNVEFGRQAASMRGFDEIDVLRRILESGYQGQWCEEAQLSHWIPKDRISLDYVRRYFQGQGETLAFRGEGIQDLDTLKVQIRRKRNRFYRHRWLSSSSVWLQDLIESSRLEGQRCYLQSQVRDESDHPG